MTVLYYLGEDNKKTSIDFPERETFFQVFSIWDWFSPWLPNCHPWMQKWRVNFIDFSIFFCAFNIDGIRCHLHWLLPLRGLWAMQYAGLVSQLCDDRQIYPSCEPVLCRADMSTKLLLYRLLREDGRVRESKVKSVFLLGGWGAITLK